MGKDHELIEAARNGNISVVEKILGQKAKRSGPLASLRRGPGANVQDNSGYSPLHHAALNGHKDVVMLLLSHDASPNLPDTRGSSPLHLAAWAGHQDILKLFLTHPNRPANPNLQTIDNETPLHCAAQHGHTGALTTLLAHGADPNVTNSRNETPLDLAAQYGRLQAVQMLIRAHPELLLPFKTENSNQNNQSSDSSGNQMNKIIRINHSPLHLASRNGHKNVVQVLLAAGTDVNLLTTSGTALHEAALWGKDGVVKTLLDSGANLDATDCEGRTALDILEEFPPHVTKGIVSVINSHRNSIMYDSESEDVREDYTHPKHHITPISLGSFYENNRISPTHNYCYSPHDVITSPSSSMGSLELPSPSPRPRVSTDDIPDMYISMAPINHRKPTAPKKPPRRNLSVSPILLKTHNIPQSTLTDGCTIDSKNLSPGAYEYICLAHTGQKNDEKLNRTLSVDQYVEMYAPKPAPRKPNTAFYENTILKSYNPNRKLKRNRDNYEQFNIDFNKDKINNSASVNEKTMISHIAETPQSPTNYQQPPTPEHPPPSATQAEKFIHESIRPLSQEYKRRSGLQQYIMTESGTSPPELLEPVSLCTSSGSLSSSVSISDRSVSTDCVEEYIGDVPFAGLFKGSTINLNNTNTIQNQFHDISNINSIINHERPKTLQTKHNSWNLNKNEIYSFNINDGEIPGKTLSSKFNDSISLSTGFYNSSSRQSDNSSEDIGENQAEQKKKYHRKQIQNNINSCIKTMEGNISVDDCSNKFGRKLLAYDKISEEVLSPFNEQEAWAKISEIMKSFGSGLFTDDSRITSKKNLSKSQEELSVFLAKHNLKHLENSLVNNGFDHLDYLNGIMDESDMNCLGISVNDRKNLLECIKTLSKPPSLPIFINNNNSVLSLDQWLKDIHLSEYLNIFRRHLLTNMEGVCRIWEVELQTVLEINKIGHRKRILHSVSSNRIPATQSIDDVNTDINPLKENIYKLNDNFIEKLQESQSSNCIKELKTNKNNLSNGNGSCSLKQSNKKTRPAPKPPIRASSLEIRAPSELLLGLPSNLRTQWRHSANNLIFGAVNYDAYYLGSTVVKELRGTESTRKSIQKLKRGDRILPFNVYNSRQIQSQKPINSQSSNVQQIRRQPVRLSISHRGVEFIGIETQTTICEHEIRNINCACQDADDLSHFAYITKDADMNIHYCHVFNVDSMDLATEIILTLGQAFEVAYQIALKEASSKIALRIPPHSSGYKSAN